MILLTHAARTISPPRTSNPRERSEKSPETGFAPAMSSDAYQSEAENLIRRLLAEIRRGVFWPPAPSDAWQWDYAGLLYDRPELSVRSDWIADQEVRLARKEVPR